MILSDNETKIDLLNSETIAETIIKLIRERPAHPVTVGVHGDWGAGKSSVLEMIEAKLENEEKVLCIKFNGWRFQGFEDAKIALIEGIVTELIEKRSLFTKAKEEVQDIYERIDWLKVAKKTGSFLFTAFTGIPTGEVVQTFLGGLENLAKNPGEYATPDNLRNIYTQANSLLKPKDPSKNVPKEISEFRKSFDKLLEKAGIEQLIVLVDDLDRCLPDTAIETLEAIRLFIFTTRTAFVVAADEGMIEYAVKKHFPDLPETSLHQAYTRNYLEKLIQVPFRIPIMGEMETKTYVTLLLIGNEIGDSSSELNDLINEARNRLKKPWESKPIDSEAIRKAFGDKAPDVQTALMISEQIGPILASGTRGNPRQIKRFLNTLILRHRTAEARGFGQQINLTVLAKLMIAERFLPKLFDQVASLTATSPNGKCNELKLLEKEVKSKEETPNAESGKKKKEEKQVEVSKPTSSDNLIFFEWTSTQDIRTWASVSPELADIDLRPYLFVAKDKKDFFGTSTSLGHLAALVEKLLGKRMAVQVFDGDIKKLSGTEANQIFEALRTKIISSDQFATEPDGIAGLALVVKSHPQLQNNLVDLLEGLPKDKLGPWVLKGWEALLTGQTKQRLDELVGVWTVNGSPFLKVAAKHVKK